MDRIKAIRVHGSYPVYPAHPVASRFGAICNQDLWGLINCGKGQPGQAAEMSHGGAPTRFRGVEVGIRG